MVMSQDGDSAEDTQILNRRSGQLLHAVQRALNKRKDVSFSDLVTRNHRKQVAAKFHTLLVLKKLCAVDVQQKTCFDKISITRGPAFDSIVLQWFFLSNICVLVTVVVIRSACFVVLFCLAFNDTKLYNFRHFNFRFLFLNIIDFYFSFSFEHYWLLLQFQLWNNLNGLPSTVNFQIPTFTFQMIIMRSAYYLNNKRVYLIFLNPLKCRGNCIATSNNMKLVHWPLMGGLLIWYSEEGTGWGRSPPRSLLAVPNVIVHRSMASVPITVLVRCCVVLMCPFKGLKKASLW